MRCARLSVVAFGAASIALSLLPAGISRGDFQFSNVRQSVMVDGIAYDRVTFFARNDGTGYTAGGSKLQGMDITVKSTGVMRFDTGHVFDTATPTSDGKDFILSESNTALDILLTAPQSDLLGPNLNSTRVISECFGPAMIALIATSPQSTSKNGFDPVSAYSNLKQFSIVGVALGTAAAVPAGTAPGAAFASVFTTPGANITVSGQIGGDTGTAGPVGAMAAAPADVYRPFAYTAVAPEPATLGALMLLAPLARRRRA